MRALPALAFALATLCTVPDAFGARGDETQMITRGRIEARVRSPWPKQLNKGYAPVFVELENRDTRDRTVTLQLQGNDWNCDRRIEQTVDLAAGERVKLELHGLAKGSWESLYTLKVDVQGGDSAYFSAAAHAGGASDYRTVLAVGAREVPDSEVQRWIEETSTVKVSPGYTPPGSAPATSDNVQIGYATFDALPTSNVPYTSLDAVLLDTRDALPDEAHLAPMLAWVRNGGTLLLAGDDPLGVARSRPSLAAWLEERFERAQSNSRFAPGELKHYVCGMGRLIVVPSPTFLEDASLREVLHEAAHANDGAAPREGMESRSYGTTPSLQGVGEVPYRVFALLLIVFAILIGPVNFIWVRRTRRPVLLLVTIPVISGVSSVILLTYGILFQGLDVKVASHSIAMLDQREHRSSSIEKRVLYAGSAPSDGLRPEFGTSVHPVFQAAQGGRDRLRLQIDRTDGTRLRADYLPTRSAIVQVLCTERAERARLDVAVKGEELSVTNNLGTALERLVVRDRDGHYHELEARLSAGASATLQPLRDDRLKEVVEILRSPMLASPELDTTQLERGVEHALPPACYAAVLETSPFRDACGITPNETEGAHHLFGVLPFDEESWR